MPCISCILSATFGHVTAEILLIQEATASWDVIAKHQISFVFSTCVHQQSSTETGLVHHTCTTLTTSPYLSSKKALAPSLLASSIEVSVVLTGRAS